MGKPSARQEQVSRIAREVAVAIRGRLRGTAPDVSVDHRSEGRMHVWRFRSKGEEPARYLRVAHAAIAEGDSAAHLLGQLVREGWESRLFARPTSSLVLSPAGRLKRYRTAD